MTCELKIRLHFNAPHQSFKAVSNTGVSSSLKNVREGC